MTASETYKKRQNEIKALITKLNGKLKKHAEKQKARPNDWGYAGDLGRIKSLLQEMNESFNP